MRSFHPTNRAVLALCLLATLAFGCASGGASRAPAKEVKKTEKERDQQRALSHRNLGTGYLQDGQIGMAIRELRISESKNPEDRWTQLALAEAYRRKGLLDRCETHLQKALEIAPDFQQARLTLSGVYIELGRYQEAIEHASWLVEEPTFPVPWAALTNQGWAHYKLGQVGAAVEALELATQYHDGYWRAILNLGIIEADRGNRRAAIRRFARVIELEPGPMAEAEANYRMAEIYIAMGDRDRALTHLTAVTERRPNGPWGKRSEDYLDRLR